MSPQASGYSGTPLIKKLGFDRLERIVVIHAPRGYRSWLGTGAPKISSRFSQIPPGGIHWFVKDRAELENSFAEIKKHLPKNGILWVSWLKKTSALKHDVTEMDVHRTGLRHGLVDVKVAAISDDWSGLKFVYRLRDR